MKKAELFFSFLLVPLDYLMIVLAGISAYNIRFAQIATEIRPVIFSLPFKDYIIIVLLVGLVWLTIFALSGLYNIKSTRSLIKEFYDVILACSAGLALVVIIIFFFREFFSSRFIVLAGWLLSIIYIVIARSIVKLLQKKLFSYGIGVHKIIIVGNNKSSEVLMGEFFNDKNSGYEVVKKLSDFSMETEQELEEFIQTREVDEIIQADSKLNKSDVYRLFDFTDRHHITYKFTADLLGTKIMHTEVSHIAGIPIVEVKKTPLDGWGRIIKRFFDILVSLLMLFLFSPIIICTALLIKIDSSGPVFYLDYRSGQYNKRFLFYKFRSMMARLCDGEGPGSTEEGNIMLNKLIRESGDNTRSFGPLHKIKNDPRITRFGKFIRRWSIDELPQLINVLKGDMSLVGPRPHMTLETARYETHHKKVLTIKPGITGMGQVSGRSDLSFEEEVKLDTYYIENWSLLLDFSILLKTPFAVLRSRKAE